MSDSPQLENGYIKIATEIWEALTRFRIPGQERQCLDLIIRKTYGWGKKEDGISLSQFVKATGMKKQHAHRSLKSLKEKNLVVTKKGDHGFITYGFNKKYKQWKESPKKVTVTKKGYKGSPKKVTDKYPKMVNTIDTRTINTNTINTNYNVRTKKTFERSSLPYLLSETLLKQISLNIPDFKPANNGIREKTIQRWSADIDKMIRIDKRKVCNIWNMILWVQDTETSTGEFWFKNILSGSKLRKQYDKLSASITAEVRKKERNKSQHEKLIDVGSRWLQKKKMESLKGI